MYSFIIIFITNVFIMFAIERFMRIFFKECISSSSRFMLTYIVFPIITSGIYIFSNMLIINLLLSFAAIFMITLNYKSSLTKRITIVCAIYIIVFINDVVSLFLPRSINALVLESNLDYEAFGYVSMGLLFYLQSLLAQNVILMKRNNPVGLLFWVATFVIPLLSIYISVLVLGLSAVGEFAVISAIIAIFIINILTFYLHDLLSKSFIDKLKSALYEKEKEYYYAQCELMQNSLDHIKSFKHDITNHLFALSEYISHYQLEEANTYLEQLTGEIQANETYSQTGNIAFDSIINYKLSAEKEKDIDLEMDIFIPSKMDIDISDSVTIIGNLLDNAIEALSKVEKKKLLISINFSKNRLLIKIENTFNGEVKYNNNEMASLKNNKSNGYGLKNVRKFIEKYNGYLDISYTNSVFTAFIILYTDLNR